jgi:hypothetical protein
MRRIVGLVLILFVFYMSAVPVFGDNRRGVNIAAGVVPIICWQKKLLKIFVQ